MWRERPSRAARRQSSVVSQPPLQPHQPSLHITASPGCVLHGVGPPGKEQRPVWVLQPMLVVDGQGSERLAFERADRTSTEINHRLPVSGRVAMTALPATHQREPVQGLGPYGQRIELHHPAGTRGQRDRALVAGRSICLAPTALIEPAKAKTLASTSRRQRPSVDQIACHPGQHPE
jgi:hypothetical protein